MAACPTCKSPLAERVTPLGNVPGCESCAHAWVTEELLTAFQETMPRAYTPGDVARLRADIEARQERVRGRPVAYQFCPGCERQLLRRNYGERTFLLVHYCAEHGYWIHDDDVAGIVDFVRHGGEIIELQNKIERLEETQQHLKRRTASRGGSGDSGIDPLELLM